MNASSDLNRMIPSIEESYSLSPLQQGMLFHYLSAPHSGVDIEQIICVLNEDIDASQLEAAWQQVIAQHTALRTSFRWSGLETPLQDVHLSVRVQLERQDWRGISSAERVERLESFLLADRNAGFDLQRAPLFRLRLLRFAESEFRMIWTFPHALLDGRSFPIVLKEVFQCYKDSSSSESSEVTLESPQPYSVYIAWFENQNHTAAADFWKNKLAGFHTPTPLGVDDISRDVSGDNKGAHGEREIRISRETTDRLRELTQQHGLTIATVVQAAWALLLNRYSGESDVLFGATRACRRSTFEGADSIVGLFINTLPVRVNVDSRARLIPWLKELRTQNLDLREYEHTPLVKIQSWSEIHKGQPLFESIVVFENYLLNSKLRALGGEWLRREFHLCEQTNYPVTLYGYGEPELLLKISYDRSRFSQQTISRMLGHLECLLEGIITDPQQNIGDLSLLTDAEESELSSWNNTRRDLPAESSVHQLFETAVSSTPDAAAVVCGNQQLSYCELNERSNQLARYLREIGVGPEVLVGIFVERSIDMMVGLFGILKAGGAYLPLDPSFPPDRLAFMLEDSRAAVLLTQEALLNRIPEHSANVICLDRDWKMIDGESKANLARIVQPHHLAYVIYTSGSTGKPKGVMIEHRNLLNFLAGMDERIGCDSPGTWLAVTSISFDISVLELFWTLTRGYKVVILPDDEKVGLWQEPGARRQVDMDFSLFYFASEDAEVATNGSKYSLFVEGAKYADAHGFSAIWTPERHFHAFGGLFPNPSVTSAFLAGITSRVQIRAGSVVLPLHSPIRVAEEWSCVDNLSNGRVGVSFASGWHDRDFVFEPQNYHSRKDVMRQQIETVRRLWRGESVSCVGGTGTNVDVRIFPQPVQSDLPIWITAAGGPETFELAGELGANVLTHMLFQSIEDIANKIRVYREAWRKAGHGPAKGHVTLMLHTFLGPDLESVRETVRQPFTEYLKSSMDLIKRLAKENALGLGSSELTTDDHEALLTHAFERYFDTSGLFGTPQSCLEMVEQLRNIGVDEIACLIDFGVDPVSVVESLTYLDELRKACNPNRTDTTPVRQSVPEEIIRHNVTHMQCTPSFARALWFTPETHEAFRRLKKLFLGGEVLPRALAGELREMVEGEMYNMYGPTETTVWSTTAPLEEIGEKITIGKPIANTEIHILDEMLRPLPVGVAGELFIGGAGVVRGYMNRPALTAEKFVPDPFRKQSSARLYRTGDKARFLPNGCVEFLGRLDDQVKVRGYRIELGEIEAALEQHPDIRQAVVQMIELSAGDKRLVAYFTSRSKAEPSVNTLREFLLGKLPAYMIPTSFICVGEIPLTPNGKVNRRALPELVSERVESTSTYVAPRNAVEKHLVEIWESVLKVGRVGVLENFFELGGDSILAVQIIARMNRDGLQVSVRGLLDHPSISELAQTLNDDLAVRPVSERHAAVPLTPGQQSLIEQTNAEFQDRRRVLLLRATQSLDPDLLKAAIAQLVLRHDALSLRFKKTEAAWEQFVDEAAIDGIYSYRDFSNLSTYEHTAAIEAAVAELNAGLSILDGPIFRVALFERGHDRSPALALIVHPLAADLRSLNILRYDLESTYAKLRKNAEHELEERGRSFRDWADFLGSAEGLAAGSRDATYWLSDERTSVVPLTVDFPRGANTLGSAATLVTSLPRKETRRLLEEVPQAYHTETEEVLLTALTQAITQCSGERQLLVDLTVNGRDWIQGGEDARPIVGCFSWPFPALLDLGTADYAGDMLMTIKEQLRGIPEGGIGYGLLRFSNLSIAKDLDLLQQSEIAFRYTPPEKSAFREFPVFETINAYEDGHLQQQRRYLIEISSMIVDDELKVTWTYSEQKHRRSTIQWLSNHFMSSLRHLIAHCKAQTVSQFTPSDFPLANLDQDKLKRLLGKLE